MTAIQKLQFQHQALQNYRRRIKNEITPSERTEAIQTADRLEAKVRARWSVRFGAFLRRVNGRDK